MKAILVVVPVPFQLQNHPPLLHGDMDQDRMARPDEVAQVRLQVLPDDIQRVSLEQPHPVREDRGPGTEDDVTALGRCLDNIPVVP